MHLEDLSEVGGLVGENSNGATITSSYRTGHVFGSLNIGGLVGNAYSGSTVNSSFWNTETSGDNSSEGGIGKTTAEMKIKSTYTDAGWDFSAETENGTDDPWTIFSNQYPNHTWIYGPLPEITTVNDVPNDQGRHINICWNKCGLDNAESSFPIIGYNLWIEYPFVTRNCIVTNDINIAIKKGNLKLSMISETTSLSDNVPVVCARDGEFWVLAQSLYAMQWDSYTVFTQTYQDSSSIEDNPSTFFVSAHTTIPSIYFSSEVMSGYSLDNIAPNEIRNITVE